MRPVPRKVRIFPAKSRRTAQSETPALGAAAVVYRGEEESTADPGDHQTDRLYHPVRILSQNPLPNVCGVVASL